MKFALNAHSKWHISSNNSIRWSRVSNRAAIWNTAEWIPEVLVPHYPYSVSGLIRLRNSIAKTVMMPSIIITGI